MDPARFPLSRTGILVSITTVAALMLLAIVLAMQMPASAQTEASPTRDSAAATTNQDDVTAQHVPDLTPGDPAVVADGPLNLRGAAGLDGAILLAIPVGALLWVTDGPVVAYTHNWFEVTSPEYGSGWVAGEYLNTTPSPFLSGDKAAVGDGPLNMRTGAGITFTVVQTLDVGDEVTINSAPTKADGYSWYQITITGGKSGWVAGAFLSPPTASPAFNVNDAVVVADGPLNLRDGAGLSAAVLHVLPNGTELTITGAGATADGYTWYAVSSDTYGDGYVAGEFLELAG